VAETRAKSVKARKAKPYGAPGQRAINWRRVPLAVAALVLLLAAGWLVRRLMG
jgi:hypothetical protein